MLIVFGLAADGYKFTAVATCAGVCHDGRGTFVHRVFGFVDVVDLLMSCAPYSVCQSFIMVMGSLQSNFFC